MVEVENQQPSEEKEYMTLDMSRTKSKMGRNAAFSKQKTVAFEHMLDVADDQNKLVEIAEKWDGLNLKDTLRPSQMLQENDDEINSEPNCSKQVRHDVGEGENYQSLNQRTKNKHH